MDHSNTIPENVMPYLRAGSRAELDDIEAKLVEADPHVFAERHLQELALLRDRRKAHRELLDDLIGWNDGEDSEPVEMDPDRDLSTIAEALERFERDQPGDGTAEIEAFRLAVGLKFKRGGA